MSNRRRDPGKLMGKRLGQDLTASKDTISDKIKKRFHRKHGFAERFFDNQLDIHFANEYVKRSEFDEDIKFTNHISRSTDRAKIDSVKKLFLDANAIDTDGTEVQLTDPKIEKCIGLYYQMDDEDKDNVFKAHLTLSSDNESGVRVFGIASLRETEDKAKLSIKIVVIDLFHLVIPSRYNGYSKEEAERVNFNQNRSNRICISSLIEN
ncbi:hypothetical protein [Marinococcus halophilus]|uniref:hypothetical protein n=1 Tax=Marinococcus halophilus TaxID=1371 RepID=UPI0009A66C5F|nr:hypothetical protein [Marinococcus halophilus]